MLRQPAAARAAACATCEREGLRNAQEPPIRHFAALSQAAVKKVGLGPAFGRGLVLAAVGAIGGCSTPQPTDFGGSWAPLNRFADQPTEIPLVNDYVFHASPLDQTLKTMLARWGHDAGLTLVYLPGTDYALHQPVARIRTTDLRAATAQLNEIYAAQGLAINADGGQLVVQALPADSKHSNTSGQ